MTTPRAPIQHTLKCWPEYFTALMDKRKTFEVRLNDRDFQVGDTLLNREWHPVNEEYSGRAILHRVTYIMKSPSLGLDAGWAIMSLSDPFPGPET